MRPVGQSEPGDRCGPGDRPGDRRRFAANGSRVVYTDVDEAGAREAASARAGCPRRGLWTSRAREDIEAAIDWIVATCGRLDIVVNNAGVNTMAHRVTIDEFPRAEWDRILAVDLTGLYEVSRFAARVDAVAGRGPDHQHRVDRRAGPACGSSAPSWPPRPASST